MDSLPDREWMSAEEASAYLQVGRETICNYIKLRALVGRQTKKRGRIWVQTASVRKMLEGGAYDSGHGEA